MTSWKEFEQQVPDFANFGKARFQNGVAYIGTLRPDGSPRVHPCTPIIGEQLFLFMEPTSPKGKDLVRDPRYTLHSMVEDSSGGNGEFYVRGLASLTNDPTHRQQAIRASSYTPQERYILYIFSIEFAFMNQYIDGNANPLRWKSGI
ncbi:MAG: hypothetical protein U0Z26_08585 [Anaerolineales bacterium]